MSFNKPVRRIAIVGTGVMKQLGFSTEAIGI
jgi:hypothetical protein